MIVECFELEGTLKMSRIIFRNTLGCDGEACMLSVDENR